MARRKRGNWIPSKSTAGGALGVLAVLALLMYVYNVQTPKMTHARPRVGRGYATTPYGLPRGNVGALRGLAHEGGGCGCHV